MHFSFFRLSVRVCVCVCVCVYNFVCLFGAVLGLRCFFGSSLVAESRATFLVVLGHLTVAASLVAEHRL